MAVTAASNGAWKTAVAVVGRGQPAIRSMTSASNKVLTMDTLNPNVRVMEYAVRGPIVVKAAEIEKELQQVCQLLPFTSRLIISRL